jgi:methyltransferase OMS1, mitochondrial
VVLLTLASIEGHPPNPKPWMSKRGGGPFLFMSIATVLIASLGSYEIGMQRRRQQAYEQRLASGQVMSLENWNSTENYNNVAKEYDSTMVTEFWTGISLWRWWLTRQIRGKVLEVCAGTGVNIPYYDFTKVKEIHFLDQSKEMLDLCKQKWKKKGDSKVPASFYVSSIEDFPIPLKGRDKYDAVFQTEGLCSCADPVVELKRLMEFVKPGGKVYLLEHGRGYYKWVNDRLDSEWEHHAQKWGCIQNRSISKIVKESELIVESRSRWLFGTVWIIVGHPPGTEL